MSSKRIWATAVAAVALTFSAGAADAAQVVATFKGVITSGFDGGGKVFGQSDLAGLDYEISYLIDETIFTNRSAAPISDVPIDQFHYQIVSGAYATTPILSATLKVNGVTEHFDYDVYETSYADARLEWASYPTSPMANIDVRGNLGRSVTYSGGFGAEYVNFVSQAASTTLLPYRLSDGWNPTSLLYSPIPMYFARSWGDARGGYDIYYQINANVTSVSFTPPGQNPGGGGPNPNPGAVPEPATWAMMIIGFGAAGSILRRQRRALA